MIKKLMALNGVAILGVILSHTAGWGQIALLLWTDRYLPPDYPVANQTGTIEYYFLVIIRQLCTFAVPTFLVISGYFITYATKGKDSGNRWKVIRSRILNLFIPYLIWSILIFLYDNFINHAQLSIMDCFRKFLSTGADVSYFFVPLLIYLFLLSFFLVVWSSQKPKRVLLIAGLIQFLAIFASYLSIFNFHSPFFEFIKNYSPAWSIQRWIFYFCLGIYIGFNIDLVRTTIEKYRKLITGLVIFWGIACVVEPEMIFRMTGQDLRNVPLTISAAFYSLCFVFTFLLWFPERSGWNKRFTWLGGKTFGIYLLHQKSMEFIGRMAYHFFPWILGYQVLYLPLLLLVGLGLPLAAILGFQKTQARKYSPILFG